MTIIARDDQGNVVYPTQCTIICPAEHIAEARVIAADYLATVEKITADEIHLPINLSNTHFACFRDCYTHEVAAMVSWIAAQDLEWCGTQLYSVEDDFLGLFCVVDATEEDLATKGLVRIG